MSACARCQSVLEAGDLRCPVCSLPPPSTERPEAVTSKVLRCKECHAALRYSEELAKTVCGFCGAALELELSTDPVEHAEAWVPFTVSKAEATSALRQWLGKRGFFAPGDLAETSKVDSMHPVAWAAWVVTGSADVTYGTDVYGAGHKATWGPGTGRFSKALHLIVPATKGLSLEEVAKLGQYDVASAQPEALAGVPGEDFGATRASARSRILEGVRDDATAEIERRHKGLLRKTKLDAMLTGLFTRRLLLPVWVLTYRYGNDKFRVVVHGQRARTVVGKSPISPWRVLGAVAAALGLVAALIGALELYERFH